MRLRRPATRLRLLRINADGTIPTDNPFFTIATGMNRAIWAMGLRNPFTFAVQPMSGRLFVNDVGQDTWKKSTRVSTAPITAGRRRLRVTLPIVDGLCRLYTRTSTSVLTGCAITGGTFYNPLTTQFPGDYVGDYFFADYCGNWIYRIDVSGQPPTLITPAFATGIIAPVDLRRRARWQPLLPRARDRAAKHEGCWCGWTSPGLQLSGLIPTPSIRRAPLSRWGRPPRYLWSPPLRRSADRLPVAARRRDRYRRGHVRPCTRWRFGSAALTTAFSFECCVANESPRRARLSNDGDADQRYRRASRAHHFRSPRPTRDTIRGGYPVHLLRDRQRTLKDGTLPAGATHLDVVFHHDTHTHRSWAPSDGSYVRVRWRFPT